MSNQANASGVKSGHLPAKAMLIHMITNNYLIPDNGNDSVEGDPDRRHLRPRVAP